MLAAVGFSITSILFVIFALTLRKLSTPKLRHTFERYTNAYIILAVAFMMWGILAAVGDNKLLATSVVIGDMLVLGSTLLLLSIFLDPYRQKDVLLYGAGVLGFGLILVRTLFFYPQPYMIDEVLFFNSQRFVSFTLSAVFLFIWLPVNLHMAHLVTRKTPSLTIIYSFLYATASFAAVIFMLAKAPLTLVLSFTAISISFLVLSFSNEYMKVIEGSHHGKRRAKQS